jgi:exosortase A-associated hydrolase 1
VIDEQVLGFDCEGARLWGILARPGADRTVSGTAVLIVVGGPQYRAGSHRQFVLLARALAAAGHPTLRFDYTGMGDSEGEPRAFDAVGPDIRAALDALAEACPECTRLAVWGLCDAASAALMFATRDPRVAGIAACNPWARSEATLAAATVKHYYTARLLAPEFWRKLLGGGLQWRDSLHALLGNLRRARGGTHEPASFRDAMARGLAGFRGRVLLLLSGNDLTAKEFIGCAEGSPSWQGLLTAPRVQRVDLAEADHTFSRRVWHDAVEAETIAWLAHLDGAPAGTG